MSNTVLEDITGTGVWDKAIPVIENLGEGCIYGDGVIFIEENPVTKKIIIRQPLKGIVFEGEDGKRPDTYKPGDWEDYLDELFSFEQYGLEGTREC